MLNTLLESSAVAPRRRVSSLVSLALHIGAAAALVVASGRANELPSPVPVEAIVYMAPPPERAPTPVAALPRTSASPTAEVAAPVPALPLLVAPDLVPLTIPEIKLSRAVTEAGDFTARRAPALVGGSGEGRSPGSLGSGEGVFTAVQVEKAVAVRPGSPTPIYPEMLRSNAVAGSVRMRFVVDSAGRVDFARLTVLHSDHLLFTRAVEAALRRMRYLPAEVGGRPVAQLVEQTFAFELHR